MGNKFILLIFYFYMVSFIEASPGLKYVIDKGNEYDSTGYYKSFKNIKLLCENFGWQIVTSSEISPPDNWGGENRQYVIKLKYSPITFSNIHFNYYTRLNFRLSDKIYWEADNLTKLLERLNQVIVITDTNKLLLNFSGITSIDSVQITEDLVWCGKLYEDILRINPHTNLVSGFTFNSESLIDNINEFFPDVIKVKGYLEFNQFIKVKHIRYTHEYITISSIKYGGVLKNYIKVNLDLNRIESFNLDSRFDWTAINEIQDIKKYIVDTLFANKFRELSISTGDYNNHFSGKSLVGKINEMQYEVGLESLDDQDNLNSSTRKKIYYEAIIFTRNGKPYKSRIIKHN